MKKLFVQFYLLLFVCFLVMTMLVGLVYKFTAERAGRQSLDDLMKSSLYLMRSELREIPPHDWANTLKELDLNLSFDLRIEPLKDFELDPPAMQRLRDLVQHQDGDIARAVFQIGQMPLRYLSRRCQAAPRQPTASPQIAHPLAQGLKQRTFTRFVHVCNHRGCHV